MIQRTSSSSHFLYDLPNSCFRALPFAFLCLSLGGRLRGSTSSGDWSCLLSAAGFAESVEVSALVSCCGIAKEARLDVIPKSATHRHDEKSRLPKTERDIPGYSFGPASMNIL